jgi:hypothetical protein
MRSLTGFRSSVKLLLMDFKIFSPQKLELQYFFKTVSTSSKLPSARCPSTVGAVSRAKRRALDVAYEENS